MFFFSEWFNAFNLAWFEMIKKVSTGELPEDQIEKFAQDIEVLTSKKMSTFIIISKWYNKVDSKLNYVHTVNYVPKNDEEYKQRMQQLCSIVYKATISREIVKDDSLINILIQHNLDYDFCKTILGPKVEEDYTYWDCIVHVYYAPLLESTSSAISEPLFRPYLESDVCSRDVYV